jgi:hypothetical protein
MVELVLAHGETLRLSPGHPTADGRRFGDLAPGDLVDGVRVVGVHLVDYGERFTYDILPASDSGAYFAGGTLVGSTLSDRFDHAGLSVDPPPSHLRASVVNDSGSVR